MKGWEKQNLHIDFLPHTTNQRLWSMFPKILASFCHICFLPPPPPPLWLRHELCEKLYPQLFYFIFLIYLISIQQQSFCLLFAAKWIWWKMSLFNKYRCGRKCQVCLFILIENVSFCLHIKKKWLLTESSLFLESFDLLPWSFAMSYGYVSTDAWGRGADETWTLPQCSNDHSVFCSESSLWITPSFLTLLYLILFFFYPLYWFCIFDFPAYFIALPL